MTHYNKDIGKLGEDSASEFLQSKGYVIIDKNFQTRWGEIDLIAKKDKKVFFVEVKTRIGGYKGKPYEAVNLGKVKRLMRPIKFYLLKNKLEDYKLSLEVVSVTLNLDKTIKEIKQYEMNYSYFLK